jgi:hypothetical protein
MANQHVQYSPPELIRAPTIDIKRRTNGERQDRRVEPTSLNFSASASEKRQVLWDCEGPFKKRQMVYHAEKSHNQEQSDALPRIGGMER